MRLLVLIVLAFVNSFAYADNCADWFHRAHLSSSDKDCEMKCAIMKTGKGTFTCWDQCARLCGTKAENSSGAMSSLNDVAGLSAAELKLIATHPQEAKTVYSQVERAQGMTFKRFGRDWYDDESDAYRHFVWTGLLVKELGDKDAKLFFDAHESGNPSEDPGTIMDRKNNEFAMKEADRLRSAKQLDENHLDKAAVDALKNKKLVVIRPLGGPKP